MGGPILITIIDHIFTEVSHKNKGISGIITTNISDHFSPFYIQKNFHKYIKPKTEFAEKKDISSELNLQNFCISLNQTSWDSTNSSALEKEERFNNFLSSFHEQFEAAYPTKKKRVLQNKAE